jgi:hypothetical protein
MNSSEIIATVALVVSAAGTGLAGWSAYTAHAARTWQRDRDREHLATRVTVSVTPVRVLVDDSDMLGLYVTVVNGGELTEYVEHVVIGTAGPDLETRMAHIWHVPLTDPAEVAETPRELPPRSSVRFDLHLADEQVPPFERGILAKVWLASGHNALSEVIQLPDRPEPRAESTR